MAWVKPPAPGSLRGRRFLDERIAVDIRQSRRLGVAGGLPSALRAVTQEEALLAATRGAYADHEEAGLLQGVHDLLGAHLAAVERDKGERRIELLAAEHLHVRHHAEAGVDVLDQFVFGQTVDLLEAGQDGRPAAESPELATHVRRVGLLPEGLNDWFDHCIASTIP